MNVTDCIANQCIDGGAHRNQAYGSKEKTCKKVKETGLTMGIVEHKVGQIQACQCDKGQNKSLDVGHAELTHALRTGWVNTDPALCAGILRPPGFINDQLMAKGRKFGVRLKRVGWFGGCVVDGVGFF